ECRQLGQFQFVQRPAEIVLRGQRKTVNGAIALLAEKYFVEIGRQDLVLAEPEIERYRHYRFLDLAAQRLLAVQVEILDELLRKRAAALHDFAGAQVAPQRARDADGVDAVVGIKALVFDRD